MASETKTRGKVPSHLDPFSQLPIMANGVMRTYSRAPSGATSFTPGDTIEFEISSSSESINGANCYLSFYLNLSGTTPEIDGDVSSIFESLNITTKSGTVLERIDHFNGLSHLLKCIESNDFASSTHWALEGPPTSDNYARLNSTITPRLFIMDLNESGIFQSKKSFPLFLLGRSGDSLMIQLKLVSTANEVMYSSTDDDSDLSFTLTNLRFNYEAVQLPDAIRDSISKKAASSGIMFPISTWRGNRRVAQSAEGEDMLYSGIKAADAILLQFRNSALKTYDNRYFTSCFNATLERSQMIFGDVQIPESAVERVSNDGSLCNFLIRLLRAMGRIGNVDGTLFNPIEYCYDSGQYHPQAIRCTGGTAAAATLLNVPVDMLKYLHVGQSLYCQGFTGDNADDINGETVTIDGINYETGVITTDLDTNLKVIVFTTGRISPTLATKFAYGESLDPMDGDELSLISAISSSPKNLIWKYKFTTLTATTEVFSYLLEKRIIIITPEGVSIQ